jgi:hypothetical protein
VEDKDAVPDAEDNDDDDDGEDLFADNVLEE